jgi:hypothetical protein
MMRLLIIIAFNHFGVAAFSPSSLYVSRFSIHIIRGVSDTPETDRFGENNKGSMPIAPVARFSRISTLVEGIKARVTPSMKGISSKNGQSENASQQSPAETGLVAAMAQGRILLDLDKVLSNLKVAEAEAFSTQRELSELVEARREFMEARNEELDEIENISGGVTARALHAEKELATARSAAEAMSKSNAELVQSLQQNLTFATEAVLQERSRVGNALLEVQVATKAAAASQAQVAALLASVEDLETTLDSKKIEVSKAEKSFEATRSQAKAAKKRAKKALAEQAASLGAKIDSLGAENARLTDFFTGALKDAEVSAAQEQRRFEAGLAALETELSSKQGKLEEANRRLAETRTETIRDRAEARRLQRELESDILALNSEVGRLEDERSQLGVLTSLVAIEIRHRVSLTPPARGMAAFGKWAAEGSARRDATALARAATEALGKDLPRELASENCWAVPEGRNLFSPSSKKSEELSTLDWEEALEHLRQRDAISF